MILNLAPLDVRPCRPRRPARERKARYRRRQRDGCAVYSIEVGPEVLDMLCRLTWLGEHELGDRDKVAAALGWLLAGLGDAAVTGQRRERRMGAHQRAGRALCGRGG